jgi:hypothetical protein
MARIAVGEVTITETCFLVAIALAALLSLAG